MYAEAQSKSMSLDHDIIHRVVPYYYEWSALYGKSFLYWFGTKPRLAIADPDMIKEALLNTGLSFEKMRFDPLSALFFGSGLLALKGERWAHLSINDYVLYCLGLFGNPSNNGVNKNELSCLVFVIFMCLWYSWSSSIYSLTSNATDTNFFTIFLQIANVVLTFFK